MMRALESVHQAFGGYFTLKFSGGERNADSDHEENWGEGPGYVDNFGSSLLAVRPRFSATGEEREPGRGREPAHRPLEYDGLRRSRDLFVQVHHFRRLLGNDRQHRSGFLQL